MKCKSKQGLVLTKWRLAGDIKITQKFIYMHTPKINPKIRQTKNNAELQSHPETVVRIQEKWEKMSFCVFACKML